MRCGVGGLVFTATCAISAVAAAAPYDLANPPPIPSSHLELRLGVQGGERPERPWPAIGLAYGHRVDEGWWASLGWELLRVYPGNLTTSIDTGAGPIIVSGVRAGLTRRWIGPLFFAAVGPTLGVGSPWLGWFTVPEGSLGGAVAELAVDASAGFAWTSFHLGLTASPGVAVGRITNRIAELEGARVGTTVVAPLLELRLTLAALF